jgi:hypothetical protein
MFERREGLFSVNVATGSQSELQGSKANGMIRLHRVSVVLPSILDEIANLSESIGAYWDETVSHAPLQKAKEAFLRTSSGGRAGSSPLSLQARGRRSLNFFTRAVDCTICAMRWTI